MKIAHAGVASLTKVLSALGTPSGFGTSLLELLLDVMPSASQPACVMQRYSESEEHRMHLRLTVPSIALLALSCKHAGAIRRGLKNAGAGLHAHPS